MSDEHLTLEQIRDFQLRAAMSPEAVQIVRSGWLWITGPLTVEYREFGLVYSWEFTWRILGRLCSVSSLTAMGGARGALERISDDGGASGSLLACLLKLREQARREREG